MLARSQGDLQIQAHISDQRYFDCSDYRAARRRRDDVGRGNVLDVLE
jgi:hypothetical protein